MERCRYVLYFWTESSAVLPEDDLREAVEAVLDVPPDWSGPQAASPAEQRPHSSSAGGGPQAEEAASSSSSHQSADALPQVH
jgi:hypothetical protein